MRGFAQRWVKSLDSDCITIVPHENLTAKKSIKAQLAAGFKIIRRTKNETWLLYKKGTGV